MADLPAAGAFYERSSSHLSGGLRIIWDWAMCVTIWVSSIAEDWPGVGGPCPVASCIAAAGACWGVGAASARRTTILVSSIAYSEIFQRRGVSSDVRLKYGMASVIQPLLHWR